MNWWLETFVIGIIFSMAFIAPIDFLIFLKREEKVSTTDLLIITIVLSLVLISLYMILGWLVTLLKWIILGLN